MVMTRPDYWLTKFSKLRVDRARGDPAPHKPLLLLVLCDLVEKASLPHNVLALSPEHRRGGCGLGDPSPSRQASRLGGRLIDRYATRPGRHVQPSIERKISSPTYLSSASISRAGANFDLCPLPFAI